MTPNGTRKKINALKKHYGSHSNVAVALGITPRHYRKARAENFRNSVQLAAHIDCLHAVIATQK